MSPALPGLFVVGTDTGVGKTCVASAIARELTRKGTRVGLLKPIVTGVDSADRSDADHLIEAVGGNLPRERVTPLVFREPIAPCVAARRLGKVLDHDAVERKVFDAIAWWNTRAEVLIVEGIGGFLCPLAEGTTVADLAIQLDYPLVIVARRGLGTLNHTLLTVESVRLRALRIAGIVLNSTYDESATAALETNAEELARRLPGIPILAERTFMLNLAKSDPIATIDWLGFAQSPRLPHKV